MSEVLILTVLKFAGVAIALATTVWGMTRKTTFEDEGGRKRLTPSGHVAVALALGSFLVAGASQGFETLARQGEERNQALEKAEQEARSFRNEQRAQRSLNLQLLNRAEGLSQAAEARAARAEQRILTLKAAQEQRDRDLALTRQVNLGAQRNLERAQATLAQVDRLMNHLPESISIRTRWFTLLHGTMPSLARLAKSLPTTEESKRPPGIDQIVKRGDNYIIRFNNKLLDSLDPIDVGTLDRIRKMDRGFDTQLGYIFSMRPEDITNEDLSKQRYDIFVKMSQFKPVLTMTYSTEEDSLTFWTDIKGSLVFRTDKVVTVNELRKSTFGMFTNVDLPDVSYRRTPEPIPLIALLNTSGQESQMVGPVKRLNRGIYVGQLKEFTGTFWDRVREYRDVDRIRPDILPDAEASP